MKNKNKNIITAIALIAFMIILFLTTFYNIELRCQLELKQI
jgi:hypothetical protein